VGSTRFDYPAAFVALAVAAIAGAGPAPAQSEPTPDSGLAARLQAVARIRLGHGVRVQLANGARLEGRFAGQRDQALALTFPSPTLPGVEPVLPDTVPYEIPVAVVDSLWEHRRLGPAAPFVGAGVGAVAAFLAIQDIATNDAGDCDTDCWQAAGSGGILGAFLGFVVGIVVGFIVPVWDQRIP
jgi:hypothetical protein